MYTLPTTTTTWKEVEPTENKTLFVPVADAVELANLLGTKFHEAFGNNQVFFDFDVKTPAGAELRMRISAMGLQEIGGKFYYNNRREMTHIRIERHDISVTGKGARTPINGCYPSQRMWEQIYALLG